MAGSNASGATPSSDVVDLPTLFHDLSPIPQDDGPHPVCAIDYKPVFIECMDYLRAVMHANEFSERALELTTTCLKYNSANYTTWHFRRQCMEALATAVSSSSSGDVGDGDGDGDGGGSKKKQKFDPTMVQSDLSWAKQLGGSNPKNYQIWYHRRALLEPSLLLLPTNEMEMEEEQDSASAGAAAAAASAGGRGAVDVTFDSRCPTSTNASPSLSPLPTIVRTELDYIATVLTEDSKNYHAWSHRQWLARTADIDTLWNEEREYAHSLLLEDIRNNSAWNHRWFAVHRGTQIPLTMDVANDEASYAMDCVSTDPYNESSWQYLLGVIHEQEKKGALAAKGETGAEVVATDDNGDVADDAVAAVKSMARKYDRLVLQLSIDLERRGKIHPEEPCPNLLAARVDLLQVLGDKESLLKASQISNSLATKHDTIRIKYWLHRENELRTKVVSL